MGFYLSKPVTDKVSSSHENDFLKCGASSMQGWRMSQEDAHNCCLDFDTEISLFAVYDGHGGAEVAEYASRHLPTTIKEMEAYKSGDFETALKEAFLSFDSTLITQPVIDELKEIAGQKGKKEDETEDEASEEDDIHGLREEASMPLSDVIARYANGTIPKTPALKRLAGESTKSPYLRARSSKSSDGDEVSSSSICPSGSGSSSKVNGEAEGSTPVEEAASSKKEGSEAAVEGSEATCTSNGELQPTTNGKVSEPSPEEPDSAKKSDNCEVSSSSSSVVNGESPTSSSKYSKRDRSKAYKSILAAVASALDDESDESDDNDESFNANPDTSINSSSDEEVDEDGEGEEDEEDSEEEEEDEEEDEEKEVDLTNEETEEEPGKDSGCTAVVSLVTKDRVIVANAGDSRAVLSRRGVAVDLSFDHKPEDPPEMERITNAGGKVTSDGRVNGGLNLSRALGDHMYKKSAGLSATEQMITALPDIKSVDIGPEEDEFIVLACDGIWNSMSSQQVVDFIRPEIIKGEKLSAICEKLFDNCLAENTFGDGTGCDNMTCIIVRLFPDKELGPADTEASKNEGEGDETMEEGAEAAAGTKRKSEESDQEESKRQKVSEDTPDSSEQQSKSSDSQT